MNSNLDDKARKETGNKLRKIRKFKKLTQAQVAVRSGININYYARIERGEINPSLDKIEALIKALKVKSSDILPF